MSEGLWEVTDTYEFPVTSHGHAMRMAHRVFEPAHIASTAFFRNRISARQEYASQLVFVNQALVGDFCPLYKREDVQLNCGRQQKRRSYTYEIVQWFRFLFNVDDAALEQKLVSRFRIDSGLFLHRLEDNYDRDQHNQDSAVIHSWEAILP